jgi:hypothetical protein
MYILTKIMAEQKKELTAEEIAQILAENETLKAEKEAQDGVINELTEQLSAKELAGNQLVVTIEKKVYPLLIPVFDYDKKQISHADLVADAALAKEIFELNAGVFGAALVAEK